MWSVTVWILCMTYGRFCLAFVSNQPIHTTPQKQFKYIFFQSHNYANGAYIFLHAVNGSIIIKINETFELLLGHVSFAL